MAAFSYPSHVPFALDFTYLPSVSPFGLPPPSAVQLSGDLASTFSCFPCYDQHFDAVKYAFPAEVPTVNAGSGSIRAITATTPTTESHSSLDSGRTVPYGENKVVSSSSSLAQHSEAASKTQYSPQMKRKDRQRCNSGSPHSKDAEENRKPKKRCGSMKEAEEQNAPQDPPPGYIHVRARRGEATDSHSLAERVRREKVRERMKTLQDLVPGSDKVVGRALLLEKIINYVQFLQNQVEFLSMRLASMNPLLYDFGLDCDDYMIRPEELENMLTGQPIVQRTSHLQPTAFAGTANNYPVHDTSVPLFLHGEGPLAAPSLGSSFDTTE